MRYQYTSPGSYDIFGWGRPRPTIIRALLMLNIGIWLLLTLSGTDQFFFPLLGLVPQFVWDRFMIWQPATYMFMHAGFWHVAMNMFVLWMFGSELEREWGGPAFLRFYLVTGIGAGLITVLIDYNSITPVVGASGAVYGVLLAYGLAYPNREVYIYFLFPVKVKYLVGFLALMAFVASLQPGGSSVAHLTHLSGMIIAWLYLRSNFGKGWLGLSSQVNRLQNVYRGRQADKLEQADREVREEVDRILDKINELGYNSLTEDERDTLYSAAVRFKRQSNQN